MWKDPQQAQPYPLYGLFGPDRREVRILGLGGLLCSCSLGVEVGLAEMQAQIEATTGIPVESQRLFHGLEELCTEYDFNELPTESEVLLVRRTDEQVSWLKQLRETHSGGVAEWLRDAPAQARADHQVVLEAVARQGIAIRYAAPELKADRKVALAAVSQDGCALQDLCPELQSDYEVVLAAVGDGHCGTALRFASPDLQANKEVVLAAVFENGCALAHAAPHLRDDRVVVLAAVGQCGSACLPHATSELREDGLIQFAAMAQDGDLVRDICDGIDKIAGVLVFALCHSEAAVLAMI